MSGNKIRKVKICPNVDCEERVNSPGALVCACCGYAFRGVSPKALTDEEIERLLNPVEESSPEETTAEPQTEPESDAWEAVICPTCGHYNRYTPGLELCDSCGEYIQDIEPVTVRGDQPDAQPEGTRSTEAQAGPVAMQSIDGAFRLDLRQLEGDLFKIGRHALGQEYFTQKEKRKVSREHAILQRIEGAWYLSYCRKADRNYEGGVENLIYINGRELGAREQYSLQVGDEIGFAEADKSDPYAAFFRVE